MSEPNVHEQLAGMTIERDAALDRVGRVRELAEHRSRSIDKLLADRESLLAQRDQLFLRLARAEVTIQEHAGQAAWVRKQEETHNHCEGHALCDLLSTIEYDAKALE